MGEKLLREVCSWGVHSFIPKHFFHELYFLQSLLATLYLHNVRIMVYGFWWLDKMYQIELAWSQSSCTEQVHYVPCVLPRNNQFVMTQRIRPEKWHLFYFTLLILYLKFKIEFILHTIDAINLQYILTNPQLCHITSIQQISLESIQTDGKSLSELLYSIYSCKSNRSTSER
jgi:hypothetical protein